MKKINKLCMAGDCFSGKTSLIRAFIGHEISVHYNPTTFDNYSANVKLNNEVVRKKLFFNYYLKLFNY